MSEDRENYGGEPEQLGQHDDDADVEGHQFHANEDPESKEDEKDDVEAHQFKQVSPQRDV